MKSRALSLVLGVLLILGVAPAVTAEEPAEQSTGLFSQVTGFATKTGYRGVMAWQATAPVSAVVRYGTAPDSLDQTVRALGSSPDAAGMAIAEGLTVGETYYFQIQDQLSGETSPVQSFVAENAYTAWDETTQSYTINLLVQLDTADLPPEIPGDLALSDLGQGLSIFAERVYDATDGYVRVGQVLATDASLDYAANVPFISTDIAEELATGITGVDVPADCREVDANLADVLVETVPPADSHTYGGWSINRPCTSFYVGRMGWLRIPTFYWVDDLDFAATATHELAHYAFNSPDLYPESPQGQLTGADCRNLAWDGSLMHNTMKYNKASHRWEMTELDRNQETTPCTMGTLADNPAAYSWQQLRSRYSNIPPETANVVDHPVDTKARGNPDGGALDIVLLDREPGTSVLAGFTPDDTDLFQPAECSNASPQMVDPTGDATGVLVTDRDLAPNEPSLDLTAGWATWHPAGSRGAASPAAVDFHITVDDLVATPPPGGVGRYFRYGFGHGGVTYTIVASDIAGVARAFSISNGTTSARLTGAFDPATDEIRVTVPTSLFGSGGTYASAPKIEPGTVLDGFTLLSQRYTAPFTISADDDAAHCSYSVGQELFPDNRPPVAAPDTVATNEDTAALVSVLDNDSDPDGDSLVVAGTTSPRNGSVTLAPGGAAVVYTPHPHFHGTDSFTYTASDGKAGRATASVTVTVAPVPDGPEAVDDATFTTAGNAVTITPLRNDFHPDGGEVLLESVSPPTFGTVAVSGSSVTYSPRLGFTGRDRFTYSVVDGAGRTDTATVTVTIAPPTCVTGFSEDLEPLGTTDSGWRTESASTGFAGLALSVSDWFPTEDPLAHSPLYSWFSDATAATSLLTFKDDRLIAPPQKVLAGTRLEFWHRFQFEPATTDGAVLEISTDMGQTWADIGKNRFLAGGYNGKVDQDGEDFDNVLAGRDAWVVESDPVMTQVVVDLSDFVGNTVLVRWRLATDGNFIGFVPGAGWWVDDISFTPVLSATCQVNTPPTVRDDLVDVAEDSSITTAVLANDEDFDGDRLSVTAIGEPARGTATLNDDGTVTYVPNPNFNGSDTFTYTVSDGNGGSATGDVVVTVTPVNDAPEAMDDSAATHEDEAVVINVLDNDHDVDGDALSATPGSAGHGTVTIEPDGTLRYTPSADFFGDDSFTYTVSDPEGASSQATVFVSVSPVNDPPAAVDDAAFTKKHKAVDVDVVANDSDVEGDTLEVVAVSRAANGTTRINDDGTVTYTPSHRFEGVETFQYLVSDGNGGQATGTVTVTVGKKT